MSSSSSAREAGDEGYAEIDAVVGLTVLTVVLALAMAGAATAMKLSSKAADLQAAQAELEVLVQETPMRPGRTGGSTGRLEWKTEVLAAEQGSSSALCHLTVDLHVKPNGAPIRASTLRPCVIDRAG